MRQQICSANRLRPVGPRVAQGLHQQTARCFRPRSRRDALAHCPRRQPRAVEQTAGPPQECRLCRRPMQLVYWRQQGRQSPEHRHETAPGRRLPTVRLEDSLTSWSTGRGDSAVSGVGACKGSERPSRCRRSLPALLCVLSSPISLIIKGNSYGPGPSHGPNTPQHLPNTRRASTQTHRHRTWHPHVVQI